VWLSEKKAEKLLGGNPCGEKEELLGEGQCADEGGGRGRGWGKAQSWGVCLGVWGREEKRGDLLLEEMEWGRGFAKGVPS